MDSVFETFHFQRDREWVTTLRRWLEPTGGPVVDGFRLAVVNGAFLTVALLMAALVAVLLAVVRWVLPVPDVYPGIVVLGVSVAFGAVVWYRYSVAHVQKAIGHGQRLQPELFGGVAASPFIGVALLLLSSGLFGLFLSMISLNMDRAGDAVMRIIFAVLFGLVAVGCVTVARLAASRSGNRT
jgi:hypothetical protein